MDTNGATWMKRILLVDDEQPIISGLSLLIKRYFSEDYIVVGSAASGREAIEKARELSPDILLMDVQMPGISGLEAIRNIALLGGPKAFILITAYERFDIAREALSLGVCDYILKPVSRERLETALRTAADYLERGKELEQLKLELSEQDHQIAPLIRDALFYRIKNGLSYHRELFIIRKTLNLQSDFGSLIIAFCGSADEEPVQSLYQRLAEHIQYKTEALIGNLEELHYAPLLLPLKQNDFTAVQLWLRKLESVFAAELSLGQLSFSAGMVQPLESLHNSWRSAFSTYFKRPSKNDGDEILTWPLSLDKELTDALINDNQNQVQRVFETILGTIALRGIHGTEGLYRILGLLTFIVVYIAEQSNLSEQETCLLLHFEDIQRLWQDGLLSPFMEASREKLRLILLKAREHRHISPTAKRALQYIENHFSEQISLEQVADILGMAPASLSRLFSEELGTGFARTLIEYRLKRAKELMRQDTFSVKDISFACGYQDPNYFTRLFKQWTGMTPTEYAESLKQKSEGAGNP